MQSIGPSWHAQVPLVAGWYPLGNAVTLEGRLARLSTPFDVRALGQEGLALPADSRARIDLFDGNGNAGTIELDQHARFPMFDRVPGGGWAIADARCPPGTSNARIIDDGGTIVREFCAGDGIEHLQCDGEGGIWVGYFDEGVFGSFGGGRQAIGAAGINRFNAAGELQPSYRGLLATCPPIADCYALNVARDATWACPYRAFPVIRLGRDETARFWSNDEITGARTIAVGREHVVLLGGYGDQASRGAVLRLEEHASRCLVHFSVEVMGQELGALSLVAARDREMHFVCGDAWFRMTVADVVQQLL